MPHTDLKLLFFRRLPPLVYAAAIFAQSSYPSVAGANLIPHMDKLFHGLGYGILGVLVYRALITLPGVKKGTMLTLISIFISTLYGATDELHQSFMPFRTADAADLLADFTGSAAGVLLYVKSKTDL